ncbi:hypothetical protein, partial [Aquisphaera insulae]|uniref:hypothetical protein n=1 Tax=Aquisphaera insulae TaxID=2712864 RepID=UPI0013EB6495
YLTGSLTNLGSLSLADGAGMTFAGDLTNLGSIGLAHGAGLLVDLGGGKTLAQVAGSIDVSDDSALQVQNGGLRFDGGSLAGTAVLYNSALSISTVWEDAATFVF